MDKWKIAFLCALLAALSMQLSHAETKVNIIGDELEGPNVCKRIITHNVTVIVAEMVPYQETKMEWCAKFPPRCPKTVIKLRQVNRTEVLEKTQAIRECCEGYKENEQKNGCIPHCHRSCGYGTCSAPDVCKCDSGYGGPSCDITCPPGLFGTKCKKKCDCANDAQCDPYSGECHCKKGFQGTKCENTCTPDRYGEGCKEICRCKNGGKCNHVSGECYCQKGYNGPLCEEKCNRGKNGDECKSICRCQNGGICNEDLQTCKCPPGWEGPVCGNRCQPGFYGVNCTQGCECFNGATCDHINGTCICEPGFMGDKCLDQCPFNKFGVNCTQDCVCYNGATCDKGTGMCHCVPGWVGDDCSERQCPDDKYGETCNETCECEKDNTALCHPHDGKCECKEGWTGNLCNRPCPFLKYGKSCAYQCDCKNSAQCSPIDGKCICPPGFTGDKCDASCPDGTYGQDCSQRCECKNGAKCSPETGECLCKPGWQGLKCERPCEINTYGQGCSEKCECLNGACNPISGECYCAVGWTGKLCENKCEPWTFGQNCSFECICEKQNSLACDHQTGHCLCRTEYRGSQTVKYAGVKCESTCPLGYYGTECHHQCNCKNNSSCDPTTGECFCDRGWIGRTCETKCPRGYFGQNCKERCPENMPTKTTCDHVTGEFKCRPGYIGLTCDHACKDGTYGEDCKFQCKCEQGECHHVDGVCHCFPGWWGDFCQEPCPEDTWGTNCQHKCQCSNNAQCRKTDGLCICKAGFMGPKCEEVCPEGYFGNNCLEVCTCNRKPNFVCHPAHGCVCKAGWRGKNCDESIYAASTAEEDDYENSTETFASTKFEDVVTGSYETSIDVPSNGSESLINTKIYTTIGNTNVSETTNFTFITLETTTVAHVNRKMIQNATSDSTTTKFTFSPLDATTRSSSTTLFTFRPLQNQSTTANYHEATISENIHGSSMTTTSSSQDLDQSSWNESSFTSSKSLSDLATSQLSSTAEFTTVSSSEIASVGSFINDSSVTKNNEYSQNRTDKSIKTDTENIEPSGIATTTSSNLNVSGSENAANSNNNGPDGHNLEFDGRNISKSSSSNADSNESSESDLPNNSEESSSSSRDFGGKGYKEVDSDSNGNISSIEESGSNQSDSDRNLNSESNETNHLKKQSDSNESGSRGSADSDSNESGGHKIYYGPEKKKHHGKGRGDFSYKRPGSDKEPGDFHRGRGPESKFDSPHRGDKHDGPHRGDKHDGPHRGDKHDGFHKGAGSEGNQNNPDGPNDPQPGINENDKNLNISTQETDSPIERTTENPQFTMRTFGTDYLHDRNDLETQSEKAPEFPVIHKHDENNNDESGEVTVESMEIKKKEEIPVNRSGVIWGIFGILLFVGIIGTVLLYYRRRVANLKAEIGHVVRYMSDDPNRNFDNPVYSYQPSVNTDTSTLLHRHGMNNLRQTRPSNVDQLNNFDHDSNSSGRAAQYSLQYDAELMNQKNHDADQTNPNFYSSIDDHLYDEIKLKCENLDMEYDHLEYSRPQQPIVPHYHRATSSTMSTLSHRNRESDQSNNRFPVMENGTYDAPVPHPKKLNISVPLPPLPAKNINGSNLASSPSTSTASTQDENIDAIISIEKPMNKDLNSKPDVMNQQTD